MTLLKTKTTLPCGELTLILHEDLVVLCEFSDRTERISAYLNKYFQNHDVQEVPLPHTIEAAFDAYRGGKTDALSDIAAAPRGTPFQQTVWQALKSIPSGKTLSYKTFADKVGTGARAVGSANGRNPICLLYPCHRVIGADGSLTGYAGGLDRKEWLLQHEGALIPSLL
ncbi:hypothetical protein GCM10017044_13050 [Kordiimonas sediminis]|uniref:methylated-DNA--[protein]-cysteine S-methyltransferase n=1 Tax=Kordiimonas sediminis TaxID=1735581 RepID=A0A919E6V2_9PROT|nr:methylated-DNA--[protein]-cysteine S-methyltransferase [Kordiimonas sediminis]GHF19688.1 hypothetical protein GCM10017044_13050 [Kordiimonas sediminis]